MCHRSRRDARLFVMNQTTKHTIFCRLTARQVLVYRCLLTLSGIGSSGVNVQADHDCEHAAECPHRYADRCPVQQLNR